MIQWATLQLPGQNSAPFFSFVVVLACLFFIYFCLPLYLVFILKFICFREEIACVDGRYMGIGR